MAKNNLVLIGFINSGKSFLGKKIADEYKIEYINFGANYAKYFNKKYNISPNEDMTRFLMEHPDWLKSQINQLKDESGCVFNITGQTIHEQDIMNELKKSCLIVYLKADFDMLEKRESFKEKHGDKDYLTLYNSRLGLYEKFADETLVETGNWKKDLNQLEKIIKNHKLF